MSKKFSKILSNSLIQTGDLMPSFYHGSIVIYLSDVAKQLPKKIRRAFELKRRFRRLLRLSSNSPQRIADKRSLEEHFGKYVALGQWELAKKSILQMAGLFFLIVIFCGWMISRRSWNIGTSRKPFFVCSMITPQRKP